MQKNKKIGIIIIYIILLSGLYFNIPSKTSYEGVSNFDWWSNDIMISDMMYCENFDVNKLFLYEITPDIIFPDDATKAEGIQPKMFANGEYFDKDLYKQYTSNIVIQRYFYRFMNNTWHGSNLKLLNILYFINCAL